jgi:hypothetical protein
MLTYTESVLGYVYASNYQESNELWKIGSAWRPYVIQIGALAGAVIALAAFDTGTRNQPAGEVAPHD